MDPDAVTSALIDVLYEIQGRKAFQIFPEEKWTLQFNLSLFKCCCFLNVHFSTAAVLTFGAR